MSDKNLDVPVWRYPSPRAVHPNYYINKAYALVEVELHTCKKVTEISIPTIGTINRIFKLSGLCRIQSALNLSQLIEDKNRRIKVTMEIGTNKEIVSIKCVLEETEDQKG